MINVKVLRKLAPRIVWGLSSYNVKNIEEAKAVLLAIEWLSGVAVDDWPDSFADGFSKELESIIVYPFLPSPFSKLMDSFILELGADIEIIKGVQADLHKPKQNKIESKDEFMYRGFKLGYLSDANGLINRLLGNKVVLR